ncbi:MAG: formylglycine-generating enzyme family protein [Myxococcota bacterium]
MPIRTSLLCLLVGMSCARPEPASTRLRPTLYRVVATVLTTPTSAQPVPAAARLALLQHLQTQLGTLPNVSVIPESEIAFARQQAPACTQDGQGTACWSAVGSQMDADWTLLVHLAKVTEARCSLKVELVTHGRESTTVEASAESPCSMPAVQAALNGLLQTLTPTQGMVVSTSTPMPCDNACTTGETSCKDRSVLACTDGDWNGCAEWVATACEAPEGCSAGHCVAGLDGMVFVAEGPFRMGSSPGELERAMSLCRARKHNCLASWWRPEQPAHWTQVSGFWIDKTEVTRAQYDACVKAGKCAAASESSCRIWDRKADKWAIGVRLPEEYRKPEMPIVCVNFEEAKRYCGFVRKRLPTEAEWELAARGADGRLFPWGNTPYDGTQANGCDQRCSAIAGKGWRLERDLDDGFTYLAPVGSFPRGASPAGALDMSGNAWEWVEDWFDENYYANAERNDPRGPAEGEYKTVRGGSWSNESDSLRAAFRYSARADARLSTIGVRCAYP